MEGELLLQARCLRRAHALLAYLEVEVPRLLGRAQVSLFARMRGVVKLPQGSREQASEQVGCCNPPGMAGTAVAAICFLVLEY